MECPQTFAACASRWRTQLYALTVLRGNIQTRRRRRSASIAPPASMPTSQARPAALRARLTPPRWQGARRACATLALLVPAPAARRARPAPPAPPAHLPLTFRRGCSWSIHIHQCQNNAFLATTRFTAMIPKSQILRRVRQLGGLTVGSAWELNRARGAHRLHSLPTFGRATSCARTVLLRRMGP